MSNADIRMTNAIYVVMLRKVPPSPLAKESDKEKLANERNTRVSWK